jgi:hypothetical protein
MAESDMKCEKCNTWYADFLVVYATEGREDMYAGDACWIGWVRSMRSTR